MATVPEDEAPQQRCENCDHLLGFHHDEGCRYAVTTARIGANLVCVCTLDRDLAGKSSSL